MFESIFIMYNLRKTLTIRKYTLKIYGTMHLRKKKQINILSDLFVKGSRGKLKRRG